ncbi:Abi family protein [Pasteurella multocida]|uniref:Abi family protein n=1 Tax=Pasteurella multocida TaxID=747 RepID=UPI00187AC1C1|nr:Abi family protein [Pasteurella multocida]MBE7394886.1 Abi family protein [Pasteurella multocida]
MVTPIKQWLSFSEQADLLERRKLLFDDRLRLENYLRRIGYYRLSGYFHPFRQWDEQREILLDDFMPNSRFEDILSLYLFDKKLRLLALDALERIETAVKVDISHLLGEKDPLAHRNPCYFDGKFIQEHHGTSYYQDWINYIDKLIERAKRRNMVCITHNMNKYGDLPIWAICGLWDFGAMSKLYEGMKKNDRDKIAQKYGAKTGKAFSQWLKSLNEIRNICAHHDRLWNARIVIKSSPIYADYWDRIDNNRPFFYFCLMKKMLDVLCPKSRWSERFTTLMREFPTHDSAKINLQVFGLLEDYQCWDLWK